MNIIDRKVLEAYLRTLILHIIASIIGIWIKIKHFNEFKKYRKSSCFENYFSIFASERKI